MRQTEVIRKLNDQFRCSFTGGRVVTTAGINNLPSESQSMLIRKVQQFDEFNPDNDPHGEHDFGRIDLLEKGFFWKIDYYDTELKYGSENPADPAATTRVLTIMRAEEY